MLAKEEEKSGIKRSDRGEYAKLVEDAEKEVKQFREENKVGELASLSEALEGKEVGDRFFDYK